MRSSGLPCSEKTGEFWSTAEDMFPSCIDGFDKCGPAADQKRRVFVDIFVR
jgi:hypothetical protein